MIKYFILLFMVPTFAFSQGSGARGAGSGSGGGASALTYVADTTNGGVVRGDLFVEDVITATKGIFGVPLSTINTVNALTGIGISSLNGSSNATMTYYSASSGAFQTYWNPFVGFIYNNQRIANSEYRQSFRLNNVEELALSSALNALSIPNFDLEVGGDVQIGVLASDPSTVADYAHIYAKDVSASAEVFVQNEAGILTQLTGGRAYGSFDAQEISQTITVTTQNVWYDITNGAGGLLVTGLSENISESGDTLYVNYAGDYLVVLSVAVDGLGGGTKTYEMSIFDGTTRYAEMHAQIASTAHDNMSATTGITMTAGGYIVPSIRNTTGTEDAVIIDIHIFIKRL